MHGSIHRWCLISSLLILSQWHATVWAHNFRLNNERIGVDLNCSKCLFRTTSCWEPTPPGWWLRSQYPPASCCSRPCRRCRCASTEPCHRQTATRRTEQNRTAVNSKQHISIGSCKSKVVALSLYVFEEQSLSLYVFEEQCGSDSSGLGLQRAGAEHIGDAGLHGLPVALLHRQPPELLPGDLVCGREFLR